MNCENCGEPLPENQKQYCDLCRPPEESIAFLQWSRGYVAGVRSARKILNERYQENKKSYGKN